MFGSVTILCEGAACNKGFSAEERERVVLPTRRQVSDVERRELRSAISQKLTYRTHRSIGANRYQCGDCGHVRLYG